MLVQHILDLHSKSITGQSAHKSRTHLFSTPYTVPKQLDGYDDPARNPRVAFIDAIHI